jgi:hypothetical protein
MNLLEQAIRFIIHPEKIAQVSLRRYLELLFLYGLLQTLFGIPLVKQVSLMGIIIGIVVFMLLVLAVHLAFSSLDRLLFRKHVAFSNLFNPLLFVAAHGPLLTILALFDKVITIMPLLLFVISLYLYIRFHKLLARSYKITAWIKLALLHAVILGIIVYFI